MVVRASRSFLKLWLAQICTQSAVSVISIMFGILSHEGVLSVSTKESSLGMGLIIVLSTFPGLIIAPIAGVFADWFSKKSIMIASNLVRFFLLSIFILIGGWENLWLSYLLVVLLSVVLQFFIPAEGGLIPFLVDKEYLLLANSLFSLTVYSSFAVGWAFSGLLLNILGISNTLMFCGVLFLISALLLYNIKVEEAERKERSLLYLVDFVSVLIRDVKKGVIYSFKHSKLRFALLHLFFLQVGGFTLVTIVLKIGDEIYGVSPRTAGIAVLAPVVIGLFLGFASLNTLGRSRSRIKLIWLGTLFCAVGFALMSAISMANGFLSEFLVDKMVATASLVAVGLSIPYLLIPGQTILYENTKPSFRGRVLGVWLALTTSLASLVATGIGFLTDKTKEVTFAVTLIVILDMIYSMVLYWLIQKKRV